MKKMLLAGMLLSLSAVTLTACGDKKPQDITSVTSIASVEADDNTDKNSSEGESETSKEEEENESKASVSTSDTSVSSASSIKEDDAIEEKQEDEKETEKEADDSKEEIDYFSVYKKILDRSYEILAREDYWDNMGDGETGLYEAANYEDNPLAKVSYLIEDISGDKIPELLIAYDMGSADEIMAAYTVTNGSTQLIFEGYNRSAFVYCGDGEFTYEGSAGAAYTAYGDFKISEDGTRLNNIDFYFSEEDSDFNIVYFHNTSGAWDSKQSEALDVEPTEFIEIGSKLRSKGMRLMDAVSFAVYASEMKSEKANSEVIIAWANDVLSDASVFDDVIIDRADYTSKVAFSTKSQVKDFKILRLEIDASKEDEITFESEEVYTKELLNKEKLVVATLEFAGDMPNYGFSYVDEKGQERKFAIVQSGKDGSIELYEFY